MDKLKDEIFEVCKKIDDASPSQTVTTPEDFIKKIQSVSKTEKSEDKKFIEVFDWIISNGINSDKEKLEILKYFSVFSEHLKDLENLKN